jgi:hypothetical protein
VTDHVLLEKSGALKAFFDIDVRVNYLSREMGGASKHNTLFFFAAACTVAMLCMKPVIRILVQSIFYRMVNIIDFNVIILNITWLRMVKGVWNGKELGFHIDIFLLTQLCYTILNFRNIQTLIPVFFQLVEMSFYFEYVVQNTHSFANNVFNTPVSDRLVNFLVALKKRKRPLAYARLGLLMIIVCSSIMVEDNYTTGTVVFYYYAVFRMVTIYVTIHEKEARL